MAFFEILVLSAISIGIVIFYILMAAVTIGLIRRFWDMYTGEEILLGWIWPFSLPIILFVAGMAFIILRIIAAFNWIVRKVSGI